MLVAVVLLMTNPVHAQPVSVYRFELTYQGSCEGLARGELRFVGATVEMWGDAGGGLAPIGQGPVDAEKRFTIAAPESGLSLSGQVLTASVTGQGTFTLFGESCPFTLTAAPVESAPTATVPATTTTLAQVEAVEFDPSSSERLSDGEMLGIMRRVGASQSAIDEAFETSDRWARRHDPEEHAARRYALLLANVALARRRADRTHYFPILAGLISAHGPLQALSSAPGAPDAAAFNRLVRLGIAAGL